LKWKRKIAIILCGFILLSTYSSIATKENFGNAQFPSFQSSSGKGAKMDLVIKFYESSNAAFEALANNEIDVSAWPILTQTQYNRTVENPNLTLAPLESMEMYVLEMNNNFTISTYSRVMSLTHSDNFRRAIACLIDKDYIISEIAEGFGQVIDVPVPHLFNDWWNATITGDCYPYRYNVNHAVLYLAELGFNDTDCNGILNYPAWWPGGYGEDIYPLIMYVDSSDLITCRIGDYLRYQLEGNCSILGDSPLASAPTWESLGLVGGDIPVDYRVLPRYAINPYVVDWKDYQLCLKNIWITIEEDIICSLFKFYHSDFWSNGLNHITGVNGTGLPNYPELDQALWNMMLAPDFESAISHLKKVQGILVDKCVSIWLYSYKGFQAYNKRLIGIVNMEGYGIINRYTFLKAETIDGEPIRVGSCSPSTLNPMFSYDYYEHVVLDRIYEPLFVKNPYDLETIQPWLAQDYEMETWIDPEDGLNKTRIKVWLRNNLYTTNGSQFTAEDLEFNIWYTEAFNDSYKFPLVEFAEDILISKENITASSVVISLGIMVGKWLVQKYINSCIKPVLKRLHAYADGMTLWETHTFRKGESYAKHNPIKLLYPVVCESLTKQDGYVKIGSEILDKKDWKLKKDFWRPGVWKIKINDAIWENTPDGTEITVKYDPPSPCPGTIDPHGFTLGDLSLIELSSNSPGMYYVASYSSEYVWLSPNPNYFLESAPLGEIDWRWYWQGTTKPRSGYYQLDILDLIRITASYGSSGTSEYDPNFAPEADIDRYDLGHIGLLDVIILTSQYGKKWGTPS